MYIRLLTVLTFLLFGIISCYGQTDPLDDFWKDVERRKSMKKKELKDMTSKYEPQILLAFGKRIIILKQDYIYEKKNLRYVKGDDDFYGREYGIGVATHGGIVTSKHLFQPWKNDSSLLPSKGYSPVLTNVEIKSLADTMVTKKEEGKFDINIVNDLAWYPAYKQEGPVDEIIQPDSIGILMVFYHEAKVDTFMTKIIEYKPKWKEGIAEIDTQLMSKQLIGGVFFNSDTAQGKPCIVITAILSGSRESEFKLVRLSDQLSMKPSDKTKEGSEPKRTSTKEEKSNSTNKSKKENGIKINQVHNE